MKNDKVNEVIDGNYKSCAHLTVQCLGETKITSHEDAFQHHIENTKALGLMPDDMKVIKKTLSDYGFLMQSTRVEDIGFRDVVSFSANHLDAPAIALRVITRLEGNVIMSEGLVLQDVDVWYDNTKIHTTPHNNMTELYFEDNDIEGIIEKLESGKENCFGLNNRKDEDNYIDLRCQSS